MHGVGHVFVVDGDITLIGCDAWLLPTDDTFHVTKSFARGLDRDEESYIVPQDPWRDDERVRLHRPADDVRPAIWLGRVGASRVPASWYTAAVKAFVANAAPACRK